MLSRIGRYINLQPISRGGMGQVYLAEHEILPGTFVVKVLQPAMQADPEAIDRFKRECIIMSRIRHPNIVHCLEPGEEGGTWYLPMEWVRGEPLQEKIGSGKPIPVRDKVQWAMQILSGLEAAHEAKPKSVIHRDLKPSNIMVTPEGVVKLLDFGIAHEAGSKLTRVSNPGTPEFMAPEQLKNASLDARTDLFSLGIVLYMLFTGRHPFKRQENQSEFDTQSAIVGQDPEPLTDLDPLLPVRLDEIILKALSKKPEDRFDSAREMRQALESLYEATGQRAVAVAREFALKQLDRARELCELGGAENVDEAAKFVATAKALLGDAPEVLLVEDRVKSLRAEIERIEVLLAKARQAIEAHQYREAHSVLDLARSIRPNDSRLRKLDSQLRVEEEVVAKRSEAEVRAVAALEAEGKLEEALKAVERVLARSPSAIAVEVRARLLGRLSGRERDRRLQEAIDLGRKGQRDAAEQIVGDLLSEAPGDLWVLQAARSAGFEVGPPRSVSWSGDEHAAGAATEDLDQLERDLRLTELELERGGETVIDLSSRIERWHRHLDAAALAEPLLGRQAALRERIRNLEVSCGRPGRRAPAPRELLESWDS